MKITLETLPQATPEQVFIQGARHLCSMKEPAVSEVYGGCVYRTPSGVPCAAGCFISDSEYSEAMEDAGSWVGMVEEGFAPSNHSELISDIQSIHDKWYWEGDSEDKREVYLQLSNLADKNGFTWPLEEES